MIGDVEKIDTRFPRPGEFAAIAGIQRVGRKGDEAIVVHVGTCRHRGDIHDPHSALREVLDIRIIDPRGADPQAASRKVAGRSECSIVWRNEYGQRRRQTCDDRRRRFEDVHVDIGGCEAYIQRGNDVATTLETELAQLPSPPKLPCYVLPRQRVRLAGLCLKM
jgi:hypothetical protein